MDALDSWDATAEAKGRPTIAQAGLAFATDLELATEMELDRLLRLRPRRVDES